MNKDKIRVALADDQPLVREGLRYVINAQPDMTVSGEAGDGHGMIALAKETNPTSSSWMSKCRIAQALKRRKTLCPHCQRQRLSF